MSRFWTLNLAQTYSAADHTNRSLSARCSMFFQPRRTVLLHLTPVDLSISALPPLYHTTTPRIVSAHLRLHALGVGYTRSSASSIPIELISRSDSAFSLVYDVSAPRRNPFRDCSPLPRQTTLYNHKAKLDSHNHAKSK